jgi:membrane-associated phospholipid phosphatase
VTAPPARAIVAAALLVVNASAAAQVRRPFPYRLDPAGEAVWLAGGAALLGASVAMDADLEPLTAEEIAALDPADINAFDRPATSRWSPTASDWSDGLLVATVGAPLALLASSVPTTIAVMYGETILLGNGIGQFLKAATHRTRPYAYNDDPAVPFEEKQSLNARRSFPSGHAANAFGAAVFLSTVYDALHPTSAARPWIWVGSLTAAGTVSYLRYTSGKHFPTDILTGAVLGGAIGWAVPQLHRRDGVRLSIVPGRDGTTVRFSFRF